MIDTNGNPTPTVTEPLKDGGQFAPQSGGSGSGTIYINAKWQFNANALYQAKWGIDLSANVFGRQGYPFPVVRTGTAAALGADSALTILLSPEIDTFRFPNLWNTDFRVREAVPPRRTVEHPADAGRVQRVQREHRAGARERHYVDELQRAGAEPEPAHRPGRAGHRVLKEPALRNTKCAMDNAH